MKTYLSIKSECQGCSGYMSYGVEAIDGEITLHEIDSIDWICEVCFHDRRRHMSEDHEMDEQRDRERGE